jgi:hypothetical protein
MYACELIKINIFTPSSEASQPHPCTIRQTSILMNYEIYSRIKENGFAFSAALTPAGSRTIHAKHDETSHILPGSARATTCICMRGNHMHVTYQGI